MRLLAVSSALLISSAAAAAFSAACTKQAPDRMPPQAEGAAPTAAPSGPSAGSTASASPSASPSARAEGDAQDGGASGSHAAAHEGDGGAEAGAAEPPPKVKLVTIGMHVGGGPYDEPTKEPMKRSVEPRFADLARCWRHVAKPQQTDVGVDLVIEAAGGRAKVSNPRTTAVGEGFVPCVVAFFESVDFQRPKTGRTVVSYSVRFLP